MFSSKGSWENRWCEKEVMREADKIKLRELTKLIHYNFKDVSILLRAITHSSYSYETFGNMEESNEVLEYLGDAVLNLSVASYLVDHFPGRDEGDLSKMRAELVNEQTLAQIADRIALGERLRIGKSARTQEAEIPRSILADAVEALVGAIFRDGGYQAAFEVVISLLEPFLQDQSFVRGTDYKTMLQEYTQRVYKVLPEYRLESSVGPDHMRIFTSSVWIQGERMGRGAGHSIKMSEQEAARQALKKVEP